MFFFVFFLKSNPSSHQEKKNLTFLGMCFHIRRIGRSWRCGAGQIKLPSTRVRGINVTCNAVRVGVWSWKSSCAEERSQWSIVVDQIICLWQCCWNLVICLDCCGFWHCSTTPCKGLNVGNRMFYHVCHPKHFSTLAWHMQRSFKSHTHNLWIRLPSHFWGKPRRTQMTLGAPRLEFFLWKSWPGPFTMHVAILADRKKRWPSSQCPTLWVLKVFFLPTQNTMLFNTETAVTWHCHATWSVAMSKNVDIITKLPVFQRCQRWTTKWG